MKHSLLLLPAAVLVALAAVACGNASSSTTPGSSVPGIAATQSPAATETAGASGTPSAAASPTGPLASLNLPSFDLHAAPDLEAALPSSVGGQSVQKYSLSLAQVGALGTGAGADQTFIDWIHALGKNPSDVTMAIGTTSGTPALSMGAIKIAGADQATLAATFQQASESSHMTVTQATVGGKQVMRIVDPEQTNSVTYAYPKGDTLFFTEAGDDATAAVALESMP